MRGSGSIARSFFVATALLLSSEADAIPLFTPTAQTNSVSLTNSYSTFPGSAVAFAASTSSSQIGNFNQAFQNTFNVPPCCSASVVITMAGSASQSFSMDDSSISVNFGTLGTVLTGGGSTLGIGEVDATSNFDIQFTLTQSTQLTVAADLSDDGSTHDIKASVPVAPGLISGGLPNDGSIIGGSPLPLSHFVETLDPGTYDFSGAASTGFSNAGKEVPGGSGVITISFAPVPEPGTMLLVLTGLAVFGCPRAQSRSRYRAHARNKSGFTAEP